MWKLVIVPMIPLFIMLLRGVIQDWQSRERPTKRKARPRQKEYDHQWDDDDE